MVNVEDHLHIRTADLIDNPKGLVAANQKIAGMIDEFVERMPYQEARRYAKKVLSTVAVYRWLYDKETSVVSLTPPGAP